MSIQSELIRNEVGTWSPELRDLYEERCGILEYDAKLNRENAQLVAFQQMKKAKRER